MTLKLSWTLLFAFLPNLALAQEAPALRWSETKLPSLKSPIKCHPSDPSRCMVRLRAGERSPIDGILQSPTQVAVLAVRADPIRIQKRIDQEVKTAKELGANDLKLENKYRQIDNDAWVEKMKKTNENHALQLKLVAPDWYEEPWFVATVSIAGTLAVIGGSVAIACGIRGGCGK